ncbi:MAG: FGGY family carbohydrate kinase [Actinomycetota bacterium]|nr:FGGY family carbohydrate kinase [Actinomycetota bacterium]
MKKPDCYLAIDAGTSSVKVGIVDQEYNLVRQASESYCFKAEKKDEVSLDFKLLMAKLLKALSPLREDLSVIKGVAFSVLCPGLVPLDKEGEPLTDAIIHLDRRSVRQAQQALKLIGEEEFLKYSGNLPFPGGISLTSMLWIKQNWPDVYKDTYMWGHTNTFLARQFTGKFGIDPSNASFTGLYNTVGYSDWNMDLASTLGIDKDKLPPVLYSHQVVGNITRQINNLTGIPQGVPVTIGAADTACAAVGAGVNEDGRILNSTGTVELMVLCMDKPAVDKRLLLRTHPIPQKWLSMNIIGAGGASVEWFRKNFCREMDEDYYYRKYLPRVLNDYKIRCQFRPYLAGDRLSFSQKAGSFSNLSLGTEREDMLRALVNGIIKPMEKALHQFEQITNTNKIIRYTGKGSSFLTQIKKEKFYPYILEPTITNNTLIGAGMLIKMNNGIN